LGRSVGSPFLSGGLSLLVPTGVDAVPIGDQETGSDCGVKDESQSQEPIGDVLDKRLS